MTSWLHRLGPLAGLALVVLLFTVLRPGQFATPGNLEIMLLQTAVVATAALGMTLVIASGGIDLSVGAQIALATVTLASLLARGWSPAAAVVATVAGGLACGGLIGARSRFGSEIRHLRAVHALRRLQARYRFAANSKGAIRPAAERGVRGRSVR